jgi:protocatechuate 3,4-dioxygenase beta subunit
MINSQFNYSYGKDKISGQKTRGIGGSLGIYYNFQPLKINFSLQYRFSRIQSIFPKTQKRDYHQVVFRITKSFTWGKRKTLSQVKSFSDIFKGTGTVEGFVFIDLNLNNIKDSKDVTLSDIEIMIDGRVITTTDENGYYRISPIIPGEHRISLLLRKIPAFYQPLFEEKKIKIKGRKTHHLNFILVPLGFVSGKVILDVNENGVKDEDEPGLQEIQVNLLKNGNLVFSILTNSRGEFKFDNLYPGKYIIEIDSKNIKEKYKKDKKSVIEINLKPGEELREITLLIKKYRKPKIKKVFDYFTGVISGRVILDANKNGKIDSGEKGLSNIQIEILPTKLKTKTDEEGYFVFENIVPGEYILRIDIKSLPENAYFTSPISKKIKILPGQKLENQNFLFFIKK